jgi:hypothetical protein
MGETVRAWRFVGAEGPENRPIATSADWVEFAGPLELAFSGMVGSEEPLDALYVGLGNIVTRIELRGEIERAEQQLVARSQRLLWRADAGAAVMAFARAEALSVAPLWNAPESVRQYLRTQDPALFDEAHDVASADGSRAASAAIMAMARIADERAWQYAWAALSFAIDARMETRIDPASDEAMTGAWDAALGDERASVNARLRAYLEGLAESAMPAGKVR